MDERPGVREQAVKSGPGRLMSRTLRTLASAHSQYSVACDVIRQTGSYHLRCHRRMQDAETTCKYGRRNVKYSAETPPLPKAGHDVPLLPITDKGGMPLGNNHCDH